MRINAAFPDGGKANILNFKNLYNSPNNFGIMTTKPLPKLAKMKFFVTLGLIEAQISWEPIKITIESETKMAMLRNFHVMLFKDLLQIWKSFWVYDFHDDINGYFVVPMMDGSAIDWSLVQQFQEMEEPRRLTGTEREKMNFAAADYHQKVVYPTHRSDKSRYVVTRVWDDMSPLSEFPNERYANYKDYFQITYGVKIMRMDQFLIEVKGITAHLKMLQPGGEDDGRSSNIKHWDFQEILIPELCHNHCFPADYWLKATILPSLLHRLHYLLLAENIRDELSTVGIGTKENRTILELDVDTTGKVKNK
jgi:hypothetical protein